MADKVKGLARRLAYPPRKLEPPQVAIVQRPRPMGAVLDINIVGLPTDDLHGRGRVLLCPMKLVALFEIIPNMEM